MIANRFASDIFGEKNTGSSCLKYLVRRQTFSGIFDRFRTLLVYQIFVEANVTNVPNWLFAEVFGTTFLHKMLPNIKYLIRLNILYTFHECSMLNFLPNFQDRVPSVRHSGQLLGPHPRVHAGILGKRHQQAGWSFYSKWWSNVSY